MKIEKFGPCDEKNCSRCCNPVKVPTSFPDEKIPVDNKGEKIWENTGKILIPKKHTDTTRLNTYECKNYDKKTGKCLDYENRPDICRNTSCVDEHSEKNIDEQYKKTMNEKFIEIDENKL